MKIELEFGERKENSKKFPFLTLRHTPTDSKDLQVLSFYIMEAFNEFAILKDGTNSLYPKLSPKQ